MITVFGSLNVDYIFQVPHLPTPGETVLASGMQVLPGGKGANQAVAAARAGAKVCMVGAVGRDGLSEIALAGLLDAGGGTHAAPAAGPHHAYLRTGPRRSDCLIGALAAG